MKLSGCVPSLVPLLSSRTGFLCRFEAGFKLSLVSNPPSAGLYYLGYGVGVGVAVSLNRASFPGRCDFGKGRAMVTTISMVSSFYPSVNQKELNQIGDFFVQGGTPL